jgi:hypothetical protein
MGGDGGGGNKKKKKCDTHTHKTETNTANTEITGSNGKRGIFCVYTFFLSTTKYQEKKMETSGPHGLKMPTTVSNDILFSYKRERNNNNKTKKNIRETPPPLYRENTGHSTCYTTTGCLSHSSSS